MVIHICDNCNKSFNQKIDYIRHINRKYKCQISSSKIVQNGTPVPNCAKIAQSCNFCNRTYKRPSELNRHYKSCKMKKYIDKDNELKEELFKSLLKKMKILEEQNNENNKQHIKELVDLKKQNEKLQEEIKNLKTDKSINSHNTNCNNSTINQTINILSYKNTDMSHIKFNDYMKCLNRSNFCVPQLVEDIHFNPDKPENHNIYIPNLKNNLIMLYDGKDWNLHNRDDTIDEIYEDKTNILVDKVEDWEKMGKNINEVALRKFNRYLGKKDISGVSNKIKDEIKLILYNKREMVKLSKT